MADAILEGVRVLDFTQVLSGPTATRYLSELGADVIKIESPPAGDITRSSPTVRDGRSGYFVTVNRGKRSVCVNLKDSRGLALVLELVRSVDVVVENFSPGTMERLGLGWDVLEAERPGLIMCSISGFGHEGPMAHLPGYDGAAQAWAGLTGLNGVRDGEPVVFGAPVGDVLTGMNGAVGVLAALFHRERTGVGQRVETSVLESYLQAHDTALQSYSVSHGEIVQQRNGRFHPLVCPYGIFKAADGYVFIAAAADRHWVDLCTAMDRADLLEPGHQWLDRKVREDARDEINQIVDHWMSMLTRDHCVEVLEANRVPCGPVLSIAEAAEHPRLRETGAICQVEDPILGPFHVAGFPLRFSQTTAGFSNVAPHLGEHNESELQPLAGDDYASLVADGVIATDG